MLTGFDADLVRCLMESSANLGINVRTPTSVEPFKKVGDIFDVTSTRDGKPFVTEAGLVLHAADRAPNHAPFDVKAA